mgnify:CR=1 FL=1
MRQWAPRVDCRGNDVKVRFAIAIAIASGLWSCGSSQRQSDKAPISDTLSAMPSKSAGVVEVLNGTGRKGAANLVAERLRNRGYDVVKIGNAPERNYSRTLVAERRTAPMVAAGVAKAIGAPTTFAFHNENLLVDATVFVGRDFEEILPQ